MSTRRCILFALVALGTSLASNLHAQEAWPKRPVRMVIASPGGSGPDVLLRVMTERVSQALKQPVVVDNRPGANGHLATIEVAKAPADGYTVLFASAAGTVVNQALQPDLALNVLAKFTPVAQIGAGGIHLVTSPDFPAANLQEFIAYVKANPGKLNYASWGVGSTGHLVMESLKNQYKLDVRHVPYKSVPQIYQDMGGGIIKVAFVDATSSLPLIKNGKLKALGNTGTARGPALPELATFTEQGVKFAADGWYGVFVPKGTPDAVVSRLHREFLKVMMDPAMKERLLQFNMAHPPLKSPEEFCKTVAADLLLWQSIVKTNGIRIE
ncbi:Bug family tripartite tricarboxylate transporter substrate binding protein [Comamonas sp.]|uniref:Bug family tripartite tricarboxylate transporter substrate binding protein n=1 Tax=Comamonas sp. TaxID=34028 RepID=UPI003A92A01E